MTPPLTFIESHLTTKAAFEDAQRLPLIERAALENAALQLKVKADFAANGPGVRSLQIELIQMTWLTVQTLPTETVGVLLFKHIFEAAPAAAGLFSFGKVAGFDPAADHSQNPAVVKHGVSVVKTVGVAISMLRDLDSLIPVLKGLGKRHAGYGIVADHYPIVGGAFLKTLSLGLGAAYTPEVASSFESLWGIVESTMQSDVWALSFKSDAQA